MKTEYIRSPFNYTGGKYKLLSQILPYFPDGIVRFADLFCGGGDVALNVNCKELVMNDINPAIMALHNLILRYPADYIQEKLSLIINEYGLSESDKNGYSYYGCDSSSGLGKFNRNGFEALKRSLNEMEIYDEEYPLYLYALLIFSFNNQIRFNSQGKFNLPVGKRDFNARMQSKLHEYSERIKSANVTLVNASFDRIDSSGWGNDTFVYCDPPYLVTCATYNEQNGWSEKDEEKLLAYLNGLNSRNIRFALSNVLRSKGKTNHILLNISEKQDFGSDNDLQISKDSLIYLKQLLKVSVPAREGCVRPFIVLVRLLNELDYLTKEEFTYLLPLCVSSKMTENIAGKIKELRGGQCDEGIYGIIWSVLESMDNYKDALAYFLDNEVDENLICEIGMNRKSKEYDKRYYALYSSLLSFLNSPCDDTFHEFVKARGDLNSGKAKPVWTDRVFTVSNMAKISSDPSAYIRKDVRDSLLKEGIPYFKRFFFKTMHLGKAMATLSDYEDLNLRYLKTSNVIISEDGAVKFDIIPKYFFESAGDGLYSIAFEESPAIYRNCPLAEISPSLVFDEQVILGKIRRDYNVSANTLEDVVRFVEDKRYERFNALIDSKFGDSQLEWLIDRITSRMKTAANFKDIDEEIQSEVTDNADVPTIFEYVIGIIWYKISDRKGRILDFMKLSLDADLLPVTHAAGGEADIVYEYQESESYPAHTLLLEATLAEGSNQRRMEMEPVSRHLGERLLANPSSVAYCIFVTTFLHPQVIADFRSRKTAYYYGYQDNSYVKGMKIIPLDTSDLKRLLMDKKSYSEVYQRFESAYQCSEEEPLKWYNEHVKSLRR